MDVKWVSYTVSADYLHDNGLRPDDTERLKPQIRAWYEEQGIKVEPVVRVVENYGPGFSVRVPGGAAAEADASEAWAYAIVNYEKEPQPRKQLHTASTPRQSAPVTTNAPEVVQALAQLDARLKRIEDRLERPVNVRMGASDTVSFGCWLSVGLALFSVVTVLLLVSLGSAGMISLF